MGSNKNKKWGKATIAGLVAAATLASPVVGAFAADGGGGSGDGTGAGDGSAGGTGKITWVYKDSFGSPTRENVKSAMGSVGVKSMDGSESNSAIDEAVNGANAECVARSKASGNQNPTCRLVSVGFVHTPGANGDWYTGANGTFDAAKWKAAYNASGIPNNTYSYQGANYTTRSFFSDGQTSINSLAAREMSKAPRAVVAIVLDQDEPPVDYDLTVSTQAGGLFTQAGSTDDVSDAITTSRGGSTISEDVTGTVTLHWTGLDGTTRTASKQFTQNNNTTKSVSFGYRDVDKSWKVWPAGSYYYDVTVGKQGHMKAAASHMGAQDAKESWKPVPTPPSKKLTNMAGQQVTAEAQQIASGSLYTAHITAQSNASEHFWLYDTIDVTGQKVLIGGTDKDDYSKITVTDQDGNTVKADITVDDSHAGKRVVKAHVLNPVSGQYTLNVPQSATPTGTDYTIPDDSQACWTGDEYGNADKSHCQTGNSEQVGKVTPKPDKVWVLDSNGALTAEDPQHTNDKGSDNRTFVTGDAIGAVVNGRIPAHLLNPFTSYAITDDWTASAQWIDWNHKDQVKVYVDGADVTDQFDITIDTAKHTTTATAKQSFLTKTAFGTKDRKVKLYIGGIVKQVPNAQAAADQKKLTNKATETWNNESQPTNEPPVYVRNPKPDKVWSADQGQAATAEDTAWSNKVNADTHTFVQQDDFGVTVNGLLPKNLARKMSSYELGDDFSKSARNIDLDSATVTVTIDGKDANSLFDVHKQDDRVWITAKQPLLDTTYNQAADRKVRMTIKGAFTKGVLKAGQKVQLTNGDWEKWNQQTVPGNEPPVREWSPNPDKSWIKLGDDGTWQAVVDPDETNRTGADTQKFLDGDQVASVVNGVIASDLVKVTDIKLTDDYAKADYIWDLTSDKSKIRVYEADATTDAASSVADIANKGRDVTDQFDITVQGTKVTATAKPEYRAAQAGLKNPKQISLLLPGVVNFANGKGAAQVRKDFRKAAGDELTFCENPDGSKLTNSGSEKVNNESQPTNEPHICGYVPPVKKKVIAEGSQGGANNDADDKVVYPGQKVEYRLTTQPKLPADQQGTAIYQDVKVTPGTMMKWSLKHSSATSAYVDKMQVMIGEPYKETAQEATRIASENGNKVGEKMTTISTPTTSDRADNKKWDTYSGTYLVPDGVTTVRFTFKSVASAEWYSGNDLDDIEFSRSYKLTYDKNSSDASGQVPSDTTANTVKQAKAKTSGTVKTVADDDSSKSLTVNPGFDVPDYSKLDDGGLHWMYVNPSEGNAWSYYDYINPSAPKHQVAGLSQATFGWQELTGGDYKTTSFELHREKNGNVCADVHGSRTIGQTIDTQAGVAYTVSIRHSGRSKGNAGSVQVLVGPDKDHLQPLEMSRMNVSRTGAKYGDKTGKVGTVITTHSDSVDSTEGDHPAWDHSDDWETYSGTYVATGGKTVFAYRGVDENGDSVIDDLSFKLAYRLSYDKNAADAAGSIPSDEYGKENTVKQAKAKTTGTVRAVADRTASGLTVHDLKKGDIAPAQYGDFKFSTTDGFTAEQVTDVNGFTIKKNSNPFWEATYTDGTDTAYFPTKDGASLVLHHVGQWRDSSGAQRWLNARITVNGQNLGFLCYETDTHHFNVGYGKWDKHPTTRPYMDATVDFLLDDGSTPQGLRGVTGFADLDGGTSGYNEGIELVSGFDGAYVRSDAHLTRFGTNGWAGTTDENANVSDSHGMKHYVGATFTGSSLRVRWSVSSGQARGSGFQPVDSTRTDGKVSDLVQRTTTHEDGSVTVRTIDTSTDVVSGCQVYYPAGQRITLATMAKDDDCWDSSMLSRPGHTQLGWNQDRNATAAQPEVTMVEGGMTVYAVWVGNPVLTYDTNKPATWSGQMPSTPASVSVAYNTAAADGSGWAAGDTSKIRGYKFLGWYTAPQDNTGLYQWATPLTGNVTVYAHWQRLQANVIYNANGGTGSHPNTTGWQYSDVTIPGDTSKSFKRDKYVFKGWGTKPGKADVVYKDGSKVALQDKDITLYAQWQEVHENFVETGGIGLPIAIAGGVLLLMFGIGSTVMLTRRMNGHGMPDDE